MQRRERLLVAKQSIERAAKAANGTTDRRRGLGFQVHGEAILIVAPQRNIFVASVTPDLDPFAKVEDS